MLWEAQSLERKGHHKWAREKLRAALERYPENVFLLTTLATLVGRWGDPNEARALFERACAVTPASPVPLQARALMEERLGEFAAASSLFEAATEVDPTHAPVWQAWGLFSRRRGSVKEARRLFQRALAADPSHIQSLHALGHLERDAGRMPQARKAFESATELDALHTPSWQAWAELEWKEGNRSRSRRLFRRAITAAETSMKEGGRWSGFARRWSSSAHTALGTLETFTPLEGGIYLNFKRGRQLLARSIELDRTNAHSYLQYGRCLYRSGERDEARAVLLKGLQFCPRNHPIMHALALCDANDGRAEEAEERLRSIVQADERNGLSWHVLGLLRERAGDPAEARRCYRQGMAARNLSRGLAYNRNGSPFPFERPPSTTCAVGLALLEANLGNVAEARQIFLEITSPENIQPLPAVDQAYILRMRALFEKKHGSATATRSCFEQSAELHSADPMLWLQWGQFERRQEEGAARARALFKRGITFARQPSPYLWQALAALEVSEGNLADATEAFEAATSQCDYAPLWMDYAVFVAQATGDAASAEQLYQRGRNAAHGHASSNPYPETLAEALAFDQGAYYDDAPPPDLVTVAHDPEQDVPQIFTI